MGSKRRRNQQEAPIEVPIFIPTADGQSGDIVLGRGEMRGSTLVLSFNDLIPAQAIAHRIQRGGLVGLTFIIPAEENEQHDANEAAIQAAQDERRERIETLRAAGYTEEQITAAIELSEREKWDLDLLADLPEANKE